MERAICIHPECNEPRHNYSGLCREHFYERRRMKRTLCNIPECSEPRLKSRAVCRKHHNERNKEYNNTDKCREYHRGYTREYRKTEKWKEYRENVERLLVLKRKYKLRTPEYKAMLEAQKGVCKICGRPETRTHKRTGKVYQLSVDHDHTTQQVRALLCARCNVKLGKVERAGQDKQDKQDKRYTDYLAEYAAKQPLDEKEISI